MQAQRILACLPAQTPAMLQTLSVEQCHGKTQKKHSKYRDLLQLVRAAAPDPKHLPVPDPAFENMLLNCNLGMGMMTPKSFRKRVQALSCLCPVEAYSATLKGIIRPRLN